MAFNTKLKLIDAKFEQVSGATLTLSGNTIIADSGELKYTTHPTFSEDTQIIDKKYVDDNIVSGVTGATTYNLLSPAAIEVGGIDIGYELTGKTTNCIIQDMLFPELCGTLTAPSTNTILNNGASANACYEIGCTLASFDVVSNFDRGCINPQYCSTSDKRSGDANNYCFTGTQMPSGQQACTALSATQTVTSYDVVQGSNTWGSYTFYDAGVQPKSNKDQNFGSPLSAGDTSPVDTVSFIGAYPLYATTSSLTPTKQSLRDMSTANNIQYTLVTEAGGGGDKQEFQIPCAWLSSRELTAVCQFDTVSSTWKYPGGSASASLNLYTTGSTTQSIQSASIDYRTYTHNGVERDPVQIRLVF
jgi:hypothetical protein